MKRVAQVAAQAKINVWLHVGGADAGGYHRIHTLFQRIDLADDVTVRVHDSPGDFLTATGPAVPAAGLGPPHANLAIRAVHAFRLRVGWPSGASIEIEKQIPVGGGLGGGSADAAAVLRALNALAPEPLSLEELSLAALSLGSDVPFLVSNAVRAVGEGRGEQLSPFPLTLPPSPVVLVLPPFGISTAEAYGWLDRAGTRDRFGVRLPAAGPGADPWRALDLGNDFEAVVEARHPFIGVARRRLAERGASLARMSGSGSTVFGVFSEAAPTARELALDASVVHTRASGSVVPVVVQE